MARAAVTITALDVNAGNEPPSADDFDAENGMVITPTGPFGELLVEVTHTTATEKTVTFKAGDKPMANAAGQGDLVLTMGDGSTTPVVSHVVLSSDRFSQDNGTIFVDIAESATGTLRVYQMPVV